MAYKLVQKLSRKITLTLLLVGIFPMALMAHQFYISITSIQHQPETQKLSIKVKIFVNDLESSILEEKGVQLNLRTDNPLDNALDYVEQYLSARLSIAINGAPISLKHINQEVEIAKAIDDSVIICQLEADNVPEITRMKVHNSLLTETFDSQTNIVNIRANKKRKTINLDKKLPEDEINYR